MKLVFLPQSAVSLAWFKRYYEQVFPEGASRAKKQFTMMKLILQEHPYVGQVIEGRESRIYPLPRTPFSVIYRIRPYSTLIDEVAKILFKQINDLKIKFDAIIRLLAW